MFTHDHATIMSHKIQTIIAQTAPLTLSPCQGRDPLLKYMRTLPRDSMSSLLLCSIPRWALMLAYLAVPERTVGEACSSKYDSPFVVLMMMIMIAFPEHQLLVAQHQHDYINMLMFTCKVFILTIRNVLPGVVVPVLFGQSIVNQEYLPVGRM